MNCSTLVSWNMSHWLPIFIIIDVWSVDTYRCMNCRYLSPMPNCIKNAYHFILQIGEGGGDIQVFLNFYHFMWVKFTLRLHEEGRTKTLRLTFTVIIMKTKIFRWCHIYRKFMKIIIEQDTHCTCDVILSRVRAIIVAVEKQFHTPSGVCL